MSKLPDITKAFAEWYQEIIYRAGLADQSPTPGCIIIMPYGTALWENMHDVLDHRIKELGHQNIMFPLLIPEEFIRREKEHVKGFAPEVAVVTYAGGKELANRLVVRPTSETIIHHSFARWIKSFRDLPLKLNQWANIVRWEMRPRAFIRSREFFWQEGHTAHETREEAEEEVLAMLRMYVDFVENYLAIPCISGMKTDSDKFPGAEYTYTLEGLMPDGKMLQMGTSHLLSQSFADSFGIRYQSKMGTIEKPFLTSWGVTTRLIGAVVMVHGDKKGLVLPPLVAPTQVVIIPIFDESTKRGVMEVCNTVEQQLGASLRVAVDLDTTKTPGFKFNEWEMKGVPYRIEIGPREADEGVVTLASRFDGIKEKIELSALLSILEEKIPLTQRMMLERAREIRDSHWFKIGKLVDFASKLENEGGIYQTGWCGRVECEEALKPYRAYTRCKLASSEFKECFNCREPSTTDVIIAKSY